MLGEKVSRREVINLNLALVIYLYSLAELTSALPYLSAGTVNIYTFPVPPHGHCRLDLQQWLT
jgi:hypothetical protein